jgi:hypothetical protein
MAKETIIIRTRLPTLTVAALKARAAEERRSVSMLVRMLVEQGIELARPSLGEVTVE